MTDTSQQWYYCVKHHTVEDAVGCKARDRLGPYGTREEAAHALEKVRERNQAWKSQDGED